MRGVVAICMLVLVLTSCTPFGEKLQGFKDPKEYNQVKVIDYPYDEPTALEREAINQAFENEMKALAYYRKVLDTFPDQRPFVNIIYVEEVNVATLEEVYNKYEIRIPEQNWYPNATTTTSPKEACNAGEVFAEESINLYTQLLKKTDNDDLLTIFTNIKSDYENTFKPQMSVCN